MNLHERGVGDGDLIERARDGNHDALEALYERHGQMLFALAYHLLCSREDAEEVVQDLFVGLPLSLRRYEEQGAFVAWLRRIVVRLSLDRLRRESRRAALPIDPAMASTAHTLEPELSDLRTALERAIAVLPQDQRTVFVLKDVHGYSHAEIAEMLGIRKGTSEVRHFRAVRTLRRALEEYR
jgi:RNA polymerase sigma-70 factor, ECF subfamily